MSNQDISIQTVKLKDTDKPVKNTPIYLIEFMTEGLSQVFIASRFDNDTNFAKFVGIFTTRKNQSSYQELLIKTDKSEFVEVMFPWTQIKSIQNLVFKHK